MTIINRLRLRRSRMLWKLQRYAERRWCEGSNERDRVRSENLYQRARKIEMKAFRGNK